jgi:N-acetylmuramoyl-L-alanine amidase
MPPRITPASVLPRKNLPRTNGAAMAARARCLLAVALTVLCVALLSAPASARGAAAPATVPETEAAPAATRASVKSISFAARSDRQGYVVRVHVSGAVGAYGEPRVEDSVIKWTLYNTEAAGTLQSASAPGPVARYRTEQKGEHLVLRFRLAPGAEVSVEAYRDRASDDLLMNVMQADGVPVRAVSAERRPAPGITVPGDETTARPPAEVGGARTAAGERWKFDTVVIDAGHGGHDPGAQAYGLDEKDVVLGIARKLGDYIEERLPGVRVVYTRSSDRFVTLRDRGRIANRAGAKLFVSIHANAARNRAARGTETYFLGTHKTKTARKVMERENGVIELEDDPGQYDDLSGGAMQMLAQSAYMRQSEYLAGLVQRQFEARVERKNRGVKQAGFLVLWAASAPAILVETGFVTNRSEARFLGSDRGQTLIASGIFRAVRDFKSQYEKGLDLAAE